jgi:hypothetical protein
MSNKGERVLCVLICGLLFFAASQSWAGIFEVDWEYAGFSTNHITIHVGDEVDIVNFDNFYDLYLTGAPPPENFSADIPPFDGVYFYYLPYVYQHAGTYSLSDEFGRSVTVTVNALAPLSVAITSPTNNAAFSAPANFTVTAAPAGGATPYSQVQFFVGTNSAGVALSSPYTNRITNLAAGNYTLTAVVTDNNSATATNSIAISVSMATITQTNFILPVVCADIYSSGSVNTNSYLDVANNIHGGLMFAAFDTSQYSSFLLEINPYGLPLQGTNITVYAFDNASGAFVGSDFNSGSPIGVWPIPPSLGYGQVTTFDVTAFVKAAKGAYFAFVLQPPGNGGLFSSLAYNYGTPPGLYAISTLFPPKLSATLAGNHFVISWPTNYAAGLSLQATPALGASASWNPVIPGPTLVGSNWVVTNTVSNGSRYFRLSNH